MPALRAKSERLTGFLETRPARALRRLVEVITPADRRAADASSRCA